MLLGRRKKPSRLERLRVAVWPRRSFYRSLRYFFKRILRVSATPYAIAMGAACGAAASFTPAIGFHFLLAFALAWLLRGNLIAAALGTAIGNPLTFPLIWASTFRVGRAILGEEVVQNAEPDLTAPVAYDPDTIIAFVEATWPVLKPMLVGAVPLGLTAGAAIYVIVFGAVTAYQSARKTKREAALKREESMREAEPMDAS